MKIFKINIDEIIELCKPIDGCVPIKKPTNEHYEKLTKETNKKLKTNLVIKEVADILFR